MCRKIFKCIHHLSRTKLDLFLCFQSKGIARTQSPTTKNYAPELPTFGVIAGVSQTEVQWKGLALGEPPW